MLRLMDLRRLLLLPLAGIFLLGCATLGTLGSGGVEVGSTAAPGSPPPPMPAASGTTEPLATRLPAGSYRFTAGQAGVVTIRLSGGGVALESMEPNDGWSHRPDGSDAEGGEIELRFVGPDSAGLDLAAERDDDGTLDTRIAESTVAGDRQRTATSGDAGAVTFTIVGEQLRVDDARAENQAGCGASGEVERDGRPGRSRLEIDAATVSGDDGGHHGQAQSARVVAVRAPRDERLEGARLEIGRHARTVIADEEGQAAGRPTSAHLDARAGGRVHGRVDHQVQERLRQPVWVGQQVTRRRRPELDTVHAQTGQPQAQVLEEAPQVDGPWHHEILALRTGDRQQVVHQPADPLQLFAHHARSLQGGSRIPAGLSLQYLDVARAMVIGVRNSCEAAARKPRRLSASRSRRSSMLLNSRARTPTSSSRSGSRTRVERSRASRARAVPASSWSGVRPR